MICEYIDEVFPDPPLKPAHAAGRARMPLWTKAIDEILHPMCGEITFACSHRHTVFAARFVGLLTRIPVGSKLNRRLLTYVHPDA